MAARLKLGKFADDEYRLRVVSSGDIESPGFDDIVFDSDLTTIKVVQEGEVTLGSYNTSVNVAISDLGYIPFVLTGVYSSAGVPLRYYGPHRTGNTITDPPEIFWAYMNFGYGKFATSDSYAFPNSQIYDPATGVGMYYDPPPPSRAIMPYVYIDDRNNNSYSDGGLRGARHCGMYAVRVYQTQLQFWNWMYPPSSGSYIAKYYVFGVPIA